MRVRIPKKQLRMQLVKIELCEGCFKSVRRDYCRNKHPKEMTSDELLTVKLKKDNVNTNVATTVGGEKKVYQQ